VGRRPAVRDGRNLFAACRHITSVLFFLRGVRGRPSVAELHAVHTAERVDVWGGEVNSKKLFNRGLRGWRGWRGFFATGIFRECAGEEKGRSAHYGPRTEDCVSDKKERYETDGVGACGDAQVDEGG
jgi:hypothetical protein